MTATAHPEYDPNTQEHYNVILSFGKTCQFSIVVFSPLMPCGEVLVTIPAPPVYTHSSFLTDNYYIFAHQPYKYGYGGIQTLYYQNLIESLWWDENGYNHFYVVDRKKKQLVAVYKTLPFFFFHGINAQEIDEVIDGITTTHIACDVIAYDSPEIVTQLTVNNLSTVGPHIPPNSVRRYVLQDIKGASADYKASKKIHDTTFSHIVEDVRVELPRINHKYSRRPYRYVYCVNTAREGGYFDGELLKIDIQKRKIALRWASTKGLIGEPIFVPDPEGKGEDDGVVLSIIFSEDAQKSYLLCLDAHDFKELARAEVPRVVPAGFHGTFV
jgi:torulene dioxygenase